MYAVIETGGKQVKAKAGQYIDIERLAQKKDEKISLKNVLMLVSGSDSKIGNPYVKGALVNGQIVEEGKDDKVIVYKMRPKKGTRKKQGHRQWYSRVFIESIELDGKVLSKAENSYKPRVKKNIAVKATTEKVKVKKEIKNQKRKSSK